MKFVLQKDKIGGVIFYFDYDSTCYPLNTNSSNKITFYQEELYTPFCGSSFDDKFTKLARIIIAYLYQDDDDAEEGDAMILLDETEKMKSLLDNTYKKHMKIEEYKNYVEKLYFFNIEIQNKLSMINYRNRFDLVDENTHRR